MTHHVDSMYERDSAEEVLQFTVHKKFYSVWINVKSPTVRKQRLQHRREREWARRTVETARRKGWENVERQRRAAETEKHKAARLQRKHSRQSERSSYSKTSCNWLHNNNRAIITHWKCYISDVTNLLWDVYVPDQMVCLCMDFKYLIQNWRVGLEADFNFFNNWHTDY